MSRLRILSITWGHHHCPWRTAKLRRSGPLGRGIFIVSHLLWHGALVFPLSPEEAPCLVASYRRGSRNFQRRGSTPVKKISPQFFFSRTREAKIKKKKTLNTQIPISWGVGWGLNKAYARHSGLVGRERSLLCHSVFPVSYKGTPHSVASYDTHRNVIEDETEVLCQSRCGMVKMI
jgi:hypothetical protein